MGRWSDRRKDRKKKIERKKKGSTKVGVITAHEQWPAAGGGGRAAGLM